jgi:glycosyltransferase involved in cell wall biosynthesis
MTAVAEARSGLPGRSTPAAPTAAPATWIYVKGAGDNYWRCQAPARAVGGKLAAVPEARALRAFTQPNVRGPRTEFPWLMRVRLANGDSVLLDSKTAYKRYACSGQRHVDVELEFPEQEGTAVWTRPDRPRAVLMLAMQQQGIRVVAETDDHYFADPQHNLFLRQNKFSDENRLEHAQAMAVADAMVFSTGALRDQYVGFMREHLGKSLIPETHVCRNHVPLSDWPERVERDGPVRVGFMGSSSHVWDVGLTYGAISAAHQQGCETLMIGYSPSDPDPNFPDLVDGQPWRSPKSQAYKDQWASVVSRHIPWIEPDAYHRAALPLDIGLAPLRSDGFTLGKSDVKAIEYTISGAAVVCQNNPVYNSAGWKDGVNCLMAGSPQEFGEQTLRLIRDEKLRYDLVTAAQEYVAAERNEDVLAREWRYAING